MTKLPEFGIQPIQFLLTYYNVFGKGMNLIFPVLCLITIYLTKHVHEEEIRENNSPMNQCVGCCNNLLLLQALLTHMEQHIHYSVYIYIYIYIYICVCVCVCVHACVCDLGQGTIYHPLRSGRIWHKVNF